MTQQRPDHRSEIQQLFVAVNGTGTLHAHGMPAACAVAHAHVEAF